MAWPNLAAADSDVWPTSDDLIEWLRTQSVNPTSDDVVVDAFNTANQLLRARISVDMLKARAAEAGIVTDEDADDYDAETLEAWCPAYVRQAILIRAAAIYTRRDSANGTISFGEFAARVARRDPDVEELMKPVISVLAS